MANDLETPVVDDTATTEEEKKDTNNSPKIDRLIKIFEALEPEEQTQAFDKISVIMLPEEGTAMEDLNPDGTPVTEGLPYAEDDATAKKFNAMQDKLQDF